MRCHGLTLSRSDSRFNLSPNPISFPKLSNSQTIFLIFFPKSATFCSITARATAADVRAAEPTELSFYELLGIPESGSLVEIKHAYRQIARKFHPDVSPPGRVGEYTRAFVWVQEAYEILSDPKRRALYDRDMARGFRLAFSAQRRCYNTQTKKEWKNEWEAQLSEMKRRSLYKNGGGNTSWEARMRRQNDEQSHNFQP